ncbi:MAG: hypothetical protein MUF43_09155 [Flavobacterium sp.]|jgi:hypothetical protein|nr:hypothetical protein [Flavobacterium sp.]
MKKLNLILGLFTVLLAFGWTSAFASTNLQMSSSENSIFTSNQVAEWACLKILRVRDNRIVKSNCGGDGPFAYPNDRVSRGEEYKVIIVYYSGNGYGGASLIEYCNGVQSGRSWGFSANGTANLYTFSSPKLKVFTLNENPNFSNVTYDVYGQANGWTGLNSIRLPIGSY